MKQPLKIIAAVLLFCCVYSMHAQERFLFRSGVGHIDYYYQTAFLNPYAKYALTSEVELLYQKEITPHVRISGGISVGRNPYHAIVGGFHMNPSFAPITAVITEMRIVNYPFAIPIYAHYYFGSKKNMFVGLGIGERLFSYARTNSLFESVDGTQTTNVTQSFEWSLKLNLQTEIGYNLKLKNSNEIQFVLGVKDHTFPNYKFLQQFFILQPYFTVGFGLNNSKKTKNN